MRSRVLQNSMLELVLKWYFCLVVYKRIFRTKLIEKKLLARSTNWLPKATRWVKNAQILSLVN